MKGDPYKLLVASCWPENALQWAGKVILVLLNERNGTKNILVFHPGGKPLAWPPGFEDLANQFRDAILKAAQT